MSFTAVDAAATPAPTQPFYLRLSLQQAKTKAINFTRIRYGAKRQIVACKRVIDPTSTMRCLVTWKSATGRTIKKSLLIYRTRNGIGVGSVRNG